MITRATVMLRGPKKVPGAVKIPTAMSASFILDEAMPVRSPGVACVKRHPVRDRLTDTHEVFGRHRLCRAPPRLERLRLLLHIDRHHFAGQSDRGEPILRWCGRPSQSRWALSPRLKDLSRNHLPATGSPSTSHCDAWFEPSP